MNKLYIHVIAINFELRTSIQNTELVKLQKIRISSDKFRYASW
jgi:hypothetical protein